jgi:hypothetical protein
MAVALIDLQNLLQRLERRANAFAALQQSAACHQGTRAG